MIFDLGMAPRLNYYSGIIFRGFSEGIGSSFLRGGRYDKLIKSKDGSFMNAVGFSVDINAVIPIIKEKFQGFVSKDKYTIYYNLKDNIKAVKESIKLRNNGAIVKLIPDNDIEEIKVVKSEVK